MDMKKITEADIRNNNINRRRQEAERLFTNYKKGHQT